MAQSDLDKVVAGAKTVEELMPVADKLIVLLVKSITRFKKAKGKAVVLALGFLFGLAAPVFAQPAPQPPALSESERGDVLVRLYQGALQRAQAAEERAAVLEMQNQTLARKNADLTKAAGEKKPEAGK